jgi:hypothetical protein
LEQRLDRIDAAMLYQQFFIDRKPRTGWLIVPEDRRFITCLKQMSVPAFHPQEFCLKQFDTINTCDLSSI